jgi:hypothetical protein
MNWTSTRVPLWQIDCENFYRSGHPIELRDVTTNEHKQFVAAFAQRHQLRIIERGTTVRFERENNEHSNGFDTGKTVEIPNRLGTLN